MIDLGRPTAVLYQRATAQCWYIKEKKDKRKVGLGLTLDRSTRAGARADAGLHAVGM